MNNTMKVKLLRPTVLAALALAFAAAISSHAQSFTYGAVTAIGSNLNCPIKIAVDNAGDLFITDNGGNCGGPPASQISTLFKETPNGSGGYTQSIVTSNSTYVYHNGFDGVAVDSIGNVFVADSLNSRVLKETPNGSGGYTESTFGSGFIQPAAVAVDSSNNVYIADYIRKAIYKDTLSGGVYTQTTIVSSGLFDPQGIAVDGSGNLYVSDDILSYIAKFSPSGSTYTESQVNTNFQSVPNVATDSNGDVYFGATNITELLFVGGSYVAEPIIVPMVSGSGLVIDNSGNLFTVDLTNGGRVLRLAMPPVNFGNVNIGASSATIALTFTANASGGAGVSVSATTDGTAGGDFVDLGTGTCNTNGISRSYATGEACTVNLGFKPATAGVRTGTVALIDRNGNTVATAPVSGTGVGPQLAFLTSMQSSIGTSLHSPAGVVIDGAGDLFIADSADNQVVEETFSGGTYTASDVSGPGGYEIRFSSPTGIAIDNAGGFYFTDTGNNRVIYEIPQGSVYVPGDQQAIGVGLSRPKGVAVDGSGSIYVADTGNNRIVEEILFGGQPALQNGGTYTQGVLPISGLASPQGMVTDASGDLYIADTGNNRVVKETLQPYPITPNISEPLAPRFGTYVETVVASDLNAPEGVAVDGKGNVYIADTGNNQVLKETLYGGTYTQSVEPATGLSRPQGVSVDAAGNVYISDTGNNRIVKLGQSEPPSLSFATTAVGSTSSDSPQTVTVANIGNAELTFSIPATGKNPTISTNFTLNSSGSSACPLVSSSSSSSGTLAANAVCDLPISFVPTTSGSLSGSLILTDNTLNAANSTQTISLNGVGTAAAAPIASLSPTTLAFPSTVVGSTSASLSTTLSNTGNAPLTISGITRTGTNPSNFAISTNTCGATLAASATCSISVTFTPPATSSYTASLSVSDDATSSPQTATLSGTGTAAPAPIASLSPTTLAFAGTSVGSTSASLSTTLSNTGNAPLTISGVTLTGTNKSDFAISTNTCGATLAASATCSISVTFTPAATSSYTASLSVSDNATSSPQTAILSGTGTPGPAPITSLSPTTLAFPSTAVGSTSSPQVLTLSNTGNAPLNIIAITLGGANRADFSNTSTCGATLAASATCSISVTFTPAATSNYTASLSVSDNATSSPQTATLSGTGMSTSATDFTLTSTTSPQSVVPGATASFTLEAAGIGGSYNSPVVLSVTGLPSGAAASFAPSIVTPGSSGASAVLAVKTLSLEASSRRSPAPSGPSSAWAALIVLPLLAFRRKVRIAQLLILLALLSNVALLSGCGGGFFGPKDKTYTLTVTGTSGEIHHSTNVTLTVQ